MPWTDSLLPLKGNQFFYYIEYSWQMDVNQSAKKGRREEFLTAWCNKYLYFNRSKAFYKLLHSVNRQGGVGCVCVGGGVVALERRVQNTGTADCLQVSFMSCVSN